ncbi:MAG: hypothetical protein Faunusvirus53_1, partial [Faunusvirus sp.]
MNRSNQFTHISDDYKIESQLLYFCLDIIKSAKPFIICDINPNFITAHINEIILNQQKYAHNISPAKLSICDDVSVKSFSHSIKFVCKQYATCDIALYKNREQLKHFTQEINGNKIIDITERLAQYNNALLMLDLDDTNIQNTFRQMFIIFANVISKHIDTIALLDCIYDIIDIILYSYLVIRNNIYVYQDTYNLDNIAEIRIIQTYLMQFTNCYYALIPYILD